MFDREPHTAERSRKPRCDPGEQTFGAGIRVIADFKRMPVPAPAFPPTGPVVAVAAVAIFSTGNL